MQLTILSGWKIMLGSSGELWAGPDLNLQSVLGWLGTSWPRTVSLQNLAVNWLSVGTT